MAASDDLTDAKIGKASAEAETKIARLEGKIDSTTVAILGKLDSLKDDLHKNDAFNRDTRLLTLATIAAAAIALGGLMVAMATYGDALFGRGMSVRDVVQSTIKETLEQSKKAQ